VSVNLGSSVWSLGPRGCGDAWRDPSNKERTKKQAQKRLSLGSLRLGALDYASRRDFRQVRGWCRCACVRMARRARSGLLWLVYRAYVTAAGRAMWL